MRGVRPARLPAREGGSLGAALRPGRAADGLSAATLAQRSRLGGAAEPAACGAARPRPPPAAAAAGAEGPPSSCDTARPRRDPPLGPGATPSLPFLPALRAGAPARLLRG